jgi:hypothetical protein
VVSSGVEHLPDDYMLYKYCPNYTDNEILSLNDNLETIEDNMIWINSLNKIYSVEKSSPDELNISSQRHFMKFLAIEFNKLKLFSKINIKKNNFHTCYFRLKYVTSLKYPSQDVTFCDKIEYLLKNNIINIMDTDDVFDKLSSIFVGHATPTRAHTVHELTEKIRFKKRYRLKQGIQKHDAIIISDHLPLFDGITCQNACGEIVFMSSKNVADGVKHVIMLIILLKIPIFNFDLFIRLIIKRS